MYRSDLPAAEGFPVEAVFPEAAALGCSGGFQLRRSGLWMVGIASVPDEADLEQVTQRVYRDLFRAAAGMHLCRIWNFIPDINGSGPSGLDRYRAFSRIRSLEFERNFGPDFWRRLPAASAVGNDTDHLVVRFVAASREPAHIENPRQVPAYRYPPAYGPRPPSFSRATLVQSDGATDVFVSGTSAVVGSESIASNNTREQLECTLENIRAISRECGLGPDLARGRAALRQFSVYLRFPEEQSWVLPALDGRLFGPGDLVNVAKAGICRSELNIEIEATIRGARPG